jgi:hypothetical protein
MSNEIQLHSDTLFKGVKGIIENARKRVAVFLNAETTLLYWQVGNFINIGLLDERRAVYGKQIVATVSQQLTSSYGKKCYTALSPCCGKLSEEQIVSAVQRHLSWNLSKI